MRVEFANNDAKDLHSYLQTLIDQWPHVSTSQGWTMEQHRVWRAFQRIEAALEREGLLPVALKEKA